MGRRDSAPQVLVDAFSRSSGVALKTGRCCVREVSGVLTRKFPAALPLFEKFLDTANIERVPCPRTGIDGINAKDAVIVGSAVNATARYFVTGDKRLTTEILAIRGIALEPLTPRECLETLLAGVVG